MMWYAGGLLCFLRFPRGAASSGPGWAAIAFWGRRALPSVAGPD